MNTVGIISNDLITKNRIIETLQSQGMDAVALNSAVNFDPVEFDLIIVDMNSPIAELVLNDHPRMCMAFCPATSTRLFDRAQKSGCPRVYKNGEFFKKILPNILPNLHGSK